MKATVIGYTHSHIDQNEGFNLEDLARFAGANGGICYMKDKYFGTYVTNPEKALKRFDTIIPTGHHSVSGHSQVTVLLEGLPKILAMYLNNLADYETSEKSGRYTEMTGNTEIEVELYNKWHELFSARIVEVYGDRIDEKTVDKLAKENARYLLSVFTPTTMSYTTSIRQWNYIIDWLEGYDFNQFESGYFKDKLQETFKELRVELEPLRIELLRENKGRTFNLINNERVASAKEQFGETYAVKYQTTFVELAQAQRHRTLKYTMQFNGTAVCYYTPEIIRGTDLEIEWSKDIAKVMKYVPQGAAVTVIERGDTEDYFLKVKERICGRAQIEIAKHTADTVMLFYQNRFEMSKYLQNIVESYVKDERPKTKCELLKCKEPCIWGSKEAISRKI